MAYKNISVQTTESLNQAAKETATEWNGSFCDECGVIAVFKATLSSYELNFCGHHVRKNAENLTQKGFSIEPENYWL
jgi:hypothetical protein